MSTYCSKIGHILTGSFHSWFFILVLSAFTSGFIAGQIHFVLPSNTPPVFDIEFNHPLSVSQQLFFDVLNKTLCNSQTESPRHKEVISFPTRSNSMFGYMQHPNNASKPFFCNLEDRLCNKRKIPIRFRLGDFHQVIEMESQRNSGNAMHSNELEH